MNLITLGRAIPRPTVFFRPVLAAALCGGLGHSALAEDSYSEPTPAKTVSCQVEAVYGQAESVSGPVRAALTKGSPVATEDRILTGAEGRVILLCSDDLRITVGPASEVILTEIDTGASGWAAVLPRGIAHFARPLFGGARFEVRTPSAVASVRSTVWIVDVAQDATAVFVEEGAVDVGARTGRVSLTPGTGVEVTAEGALGAVGAWGTARIASLTARLAIPEQ